MTPAAEWFYVIAPACARPKTGPGFKEAWAIASATPDDADLFTPSARDTA